jgi:3-oxoacyl-[acyl-carrier protein] reductase
MQTSDTGTSQGLHGKVAVVTGASRGIGRAIALRLAREGADLALIARSEEGLSAVVSEARDLYRERKLLPIACDVSVAGNVQEAIERITGELGRIDILVNNAGITRDNLLLRMSEEEWDEVLAVNLKSVFNLSKAVSRHMLRSRSGRIVNVTSVVGLIGNAGQANYAASKGGTIAFTFSLARELASRGITVNAVAPGFIETDMTAAMPEEARKSFSERIPLGRFGRPEDVAEVVVFLSGSSAGYITGEVIRVDGGLAIG